MYPCLSHGLEDFFLIRLPTANGLHQCLHLCLYDHRICLVAQELRSIRDRGRIMVGTCAFPLKTAAVS